MSIKEQIIAGLKTIEELLDEKGEVNFVKLYQGIESYEPSLMGKLFNIPIIREKFFQKIQLGTDKTEVLGGGYLFKIDSLKLFLEENQINNTFTAFTNQIGLSKGKEFLKYNTDIVLDFPFKDCILEGGQSNDEGKDNYYEYDDKKGFVLKQDRRQEIFYNNIIAQDEITRLTEKKAFTNFKKFNKDGEVPFSGFTKDENANIKDNLIIKGNNLLALYSLKEKFVGKIKLIYIDPPYNTGNDSFSYNDKFNHSTWLTFMKNRLEIARELLRDDGAIFVQCDDNEQAYLKVLMDEVFGKDNFVMTITWRRTDNQPNIGKLARVKEYIILFSKNAEKFELQKLPLSEKAKDKYKYQDDKGYFRRNNLIDKVRGRFHYEVITPMGGKLTGPFMIPEEKFREMEQNGELYWASGINGQPSGKIYLERKLNEGQVPNDFWGIEFGSNQQGAKEMQDLFGERKFAFPKPEKLLYYLLNISTLPGDIILDYHLGSGTTCAVAHKMGRQYIGIEQMDYIETIPVERLKKVIEGEQGGISKDVEWKGGGEFVYFELSKLNQKAIEKINACKNYEELKDFFKTIYENYFLKYNIKIKEFIENILENKNFINLPLLEQKTILIAMLDNNQLYINESEMGDTKLGVAQSDIENTKKFYSL